MKLRFHCNHKYNFKLPCELISWNSLLKGCKNVKKSGFLYPNHNPRKILLDLANLKKCLLGISVILATMSVHANMVLLFHCGREKVGKNRWVLLFHCMATLAFKVSQWAYSLTCKCCFSNLNSG